MDVKNRFAACPTLLPAHVRHRLRARLLARRLVSPRLWRRLAWWLPVWMGLMVLCPLCLPVKSRLDFGFHAMDAAVLLTVHLVLVLAGLVLMDLSRPLEPEESRWLLRATEGAGLRHEESLSLAHQSRLDGLLPDTPLHRAARRL